MFQKALLDHFATISHDDWVEVVKGHAAVLRLDGPRGSLDIGVAYSPKYRGCEGRAGFNTGRDGEACAIS